MEDLVHFVGRRRSAHFIRTRREQGEDGCGGGRLARVDGTHDTGKQEGPTGESGMVDGLVSLEEFRDQVDVPQISSDCPQI